MNVCVCVPFDLYEPHPHILRMRISVKTMAHLPKWSGSLQLVAFLVAAWCTECHARPPNFVVFLADE